jgi:hypothetical protein
MPGQTDVANLEDVLRKAGSPRGTRRWLWGHPSPNNVGFEVFSIQRPQGIETALEGAGVGFGAQGSAPGAFYKLPHPIMPPPIKINSNKPD